MGTNTLNSVSSGAITAAMFNQFFTAMGGDLVPRQVVGSAAAPVDEVSSLGSASYKWLDAHIKNLYIDGALFDPDALGSDTSNAIVSGAVRTTSDQPDFIRASGSGANATLLATTTNLQITANASSVTITSDIALSSITLAPSTNNTCLVNDATLTDQDSSKYTGEEYETPLTISTAGTEITDRIGQYACFKTPDGEYFIGYIDSATQISRCFRGFFFDSSGSPIERGTLADGDTLTIMSLGWVFVDNNGTTVDITYKNPIYSFVEPSSPDTDDYWFDLANRLWNRYDGAVFQEVDRIPVGLVVSDATNCVASRSFDFTKSYNALNEVSTIFLSVTQAITERPKSSISVYANRINFETTPLIFDITTDLETGLTEATSTQYWLYITQDGEPVISDQKYYNRLADLQGFYHPYNTWRCVGVIYNGSGSDIESVGSVENLSPVDIQYFTSSGTWTQPTGTKLVEVIVVGGGGSGGGAGSSANNGANGGTSSFGSHCSASGGTKAGTALSGGGAGTVTVGGAGGIGSGGDLNIRGGGGSAGSLTAATSQVAGGAGGNSFIGGGGAGGNDANGSSGTHGGGGGGGSTDSTSQYAAGGGGGAGGTAIKTITSGLGVTETVTVGSGGAADNQTSDGAAGAAGIVIVKSYR